MKKHHKCECANQKVTKKWFCDMYRWQTAC